MNGETLEPGEYLESPSKTYRLIMQGDGNLVLYNGGTALWSTGTAGDNGASVTMQGDGNLVIYDNGVAKWSSGTAGFSAAYLALQDDSNLVVYQGSHALWARGSGYLGFKLSGGVTLSPGQVLLSPSRAYRLIMQGDGNLVLYQGGSALWSSGTAGHPGATATMQTDGNLVIYDNGIARWSSGTAGFSGAYLALQDDSNLVVYQGAHPVWDWSAGYLGNKLTAGITLVPGGELLSPSHQYRLIMQGDGNLVLYNGGTALWSTGTAGDNGASVTMQGDGNLVVYQGGVAKWNSGTVGSPGAFLDLQNDSNLVIYQGGKAIWDWKSGRLGQPGLGASIAQIAESQDQYSSAIVDNPPNSDCNPYTAYWGDGTGCGNGLRANAWCADFAAWAWRKAGVVFTYGYGGSNINAWSASFYFWGKANGHWHPVSSGYSPSPGDVAVYGNLTEEPGPGHVGIYVGGSATAPTVVNGNWAVGWPNPTNYGVIVQANESSTGAVGGGLDGYVSP